MYRKKGEVCHNCDYHEDRPFQNGAFRVEVYCNMYNQMVTADGWCEEYE